LRELLSGTSLKEFNLDHENKQNNKKDNKNSFDQIRKVACKTNPQDDAEINDQ